MAQGFTDRDVTDQTGRTFIVTGANTGIGFETARVLARRGARVLLGCRSEQRAADAMAKIVAESPEATSSSCLSIRPIWGASGPLRSRRPPSRVSRARQQRGHHDAAPRSDRGRFRVAVRRQPPRDLCSHGAPPAQARGNRGQPSRHHQQPGPSGRPHPLGRPSTPRSSTGARLATSRASWPTCCIWSNSIDGSRPAVPARSRSAAIRALPRPRLAATSP